MSALSQPDLLGMPFQPRLFGLRRRIGSHSPSGASSYTPRPGAEAGERPQRLFSLSQRMLLKGAHARCNGPEAGRRYIASIVTEPDARHAMMVATITIAEIVAGSRPTVRIVEHLERRLSVEDVASLVQWLQSDWRCGRVLSANPQAERAAEPLLDAVSQGQLQMYACASSKQGTAFWADVIRATAIESPQGVLQFPDAPHSVGPYVLGLALLAQAVETGSAETVQAQFQTLYPAGEARRLSA